MPIYLVGGAVRDRLLGLPSSDRDWVCTDTEPTQLLEAGFHQVGRDFPVFLHPETREEHALPRRCPEAPRTEINDLELAQDLYARDLTINAMARNRDGQLLDPWGGEADLQARVLRHVSPAFAEDPLRILRVARFRAKLEAFGFTVAPETQQFMRRLVERGVLEGLAPERIWKETSRALMTRRPSLFFEALRDVGALQRLMPEVDRLFGVPQPPKHHPEIDTGVHVMMCIDKAAAEQAPLAVRVATLLHDLGKGVTPPEQWPHHRDHESAGVPLVRKLCARLRIPHDLRDLACTVSDEHLRVHRAEELRASTMVDLLTRLQAFRDPLFFDHALWACRCDAQGRLGFEQRPYPSEDIVRAARAAAAQVHSRDVIREGMTGEQIHDALRQARVKAVSRLDRRPQPTTPGMSM